MFGSFRLFGTAIALVLVCSPLISYAEESAEEDLPTIAELQQAYVQARGGLSNMMGVTSLVATREVNGELTYEISVAEAEDVLYQRIWLHQEHFYEMKLSRQVVDESGEVSEVGIFLSDSQRVGGIWSARHLQFFKNQDMVQEVVLDKIRANVGLFDSYFEKPSLND